MSLCPNPLSEEVVHDGFCTTALPVSVRSPRGASRAGSEVLVLERGRSRVVLLEDTDGDLTPDTATVIAEGTYLTHGVTYYDGYVYASSDSAVYRWPYTPGDRSSFPSGGYSAADAETVINNINTGGVGTAGGYAHRTRTMTFDEQGRFYVQIGSQGNVDYSSFRARIRRFNDVSTATLPISYTDGELFADGLRNTVGLAWDPHGILWGVDNGGDLFDGRPDLGIDIPFYSEPADELNRFTEETVGAQFGFPYCFTEWDLPEVGQGAGTPWAWPLFMSEDLGGYTDEWCQENTIRPALALYPHSAALGVTFYQWRDPADLPEGCSGTFPREMDGYVFMAMHGSFRVTPATGYKVVYAEMDAEGNPVGTHIDLVAHQPPRATWSNGFRPVDLLFDECGRLIVTSDSGSVNVARISYVETATATVVEEEPVPPSTPADTEPVPPSTPADTEPVPPSTPADTEPEPSDPADTEQEPSTQADAEPDTSTPAETIPVASGPTEPVTSIPLGTEVPSSPAEVEAVSTGSPSDQVTMPGSVSNVGEEPISILPSSAVRFTSSTPDLLLPAVILLALKKLLGC